MNAHQNFLCEYVPLEQWSKILMCTYRTMVENFDKHFKTV